MSNLLVFFKCIYTDFCIESHRDTQHNNLMKHKAQQTHPNTFPKPHFPNNNYLHKNILLLFILYIPPPYNDIRVNKFTRGIDMS